MDGYAHRLTQALGKRGSSANLAELHHVKINGESILVKHEDDGTVQYRGIEGPRMAVDTTGWQHPLLKHTFEGSSLLEGSWVKKGYWGMWRIKLA